jgi:hypothetical protein
MSSEFGYITNFTFTESYFYGLPKVHKSEVISNAILEQHTECIKILNPDDLEFRINSLEKRSCTMFRLFSNQNVIAEIPKSCGIFV